MIAVSFYFLRIVIKQYVTFLHYNVWWLPCMWMDFVNQTLEPTNQHIHSGMCRQFTDVNAVTKCTMTSCTMANTVENTRSASRKSTPISDRFIALKIVGLAVNSKAYVVTQWQSTTAILTTSNWNSIYSHAELRALAITGMYILWTKVWHKW